jgi:hypothetical protein
VARQDLANDGHADATLSGLGNAQLGLSLQRGTVGAGLFARGWTVTAPRGDDGSIQLEITEASLAVGWSAFRDVLVVGASWTGVAGVVETFPARAPAGSDPAGKVEYAGNTLRFGALYRPRGRAWRLGASLHPAASARPRDDRSRVAVATPEAFVFPATASLGVSAWIGPNASRFNEPPPSALELHPEWGPGPQWVEGRRSPVLVTAQVDLVGKAPDAVTVESAVVPGGPAVSSGRSGSVAVRAGAEWEPRTDGLRVRGGGYVEPSRTGGVPRPHATFGAELRIPFWWRDLQLGLAGDVAERFRNVSLSLGFWSSLGPRRPAPLAPAE